MKVIFSNFLKLEAKGFSSRILDKYLINNNQKI